MKILKPLMPKYILRIIYEKFIGTLINIKKMEKENIYIIMIINMKENKKII